MTATVTRPKKTTGSNSASSRQPAQRDIVYDKVESELDRLLARHKTELRIHFILHFIKYFYTEISGSKLTKCMIF